MTRLKQIATQKRLAMTGGQLLVVSGGGIFACMGKSVTDSNNATVEIGLGVVKAFEDAINRHDFDVILLAT
jgi:prefoldin subunit 5